MIQTKIQKKIKKINKIKLIMKQKKLIKIKKLISKIFHILIYCYEWQIKFLLTKEKLKK